MYAMNIQNDVIGLVLRDNCKSKQVTDFIAWPSRCHDSTQTIAWNIYRFTSTHKSIKHQWQYLQKEWEVNVRSLPTIIYCSF
jgi:hypothetical protein